MKRKKKLKQTCLDCHFFVKTYEQKHIWLMTNDQRDYMRSNGNLGSHNRLSCAMGVWDEGLSDFNNKEEYNIIANTERKNSCFFWKYTPGMLLPAAKILQEREAANKAASRDRLLTIIGLWIAALALAADIIINLIKKP